MIGEGYTVEGFYETGWIQTLAPTSYAVAKNELIKLRAFGGKTKYRMVNREVITHELKTPEEWEAELGPPYIMDPDGWRDPNGRPWDDPITRSEFVERLSWCTVTSRKPQRLDSRVSDE